jgi:homoserine dehydrogenase
LAFQPDSLQDIPILPIDAIETAYYLRICSYDRPGMLAKITGILSSNNISIEAIVQKEPKENAAQVSVVILTHRVVERDVNQAIQAIEQLDGITGKVMRIRLETLDK